MTAIYHTLHIQNELPRSRKSSLKAGFRVWVAGEFVKVGRVWEPSLYWYGSNDGMDSSSPTLLSHLMSTPMDKISRLLSTLSLTSISLVHYSLPPCCRFYELPWALIHLCHTQAPLLWLLTNWSGCRCEGAAGHIWFLQPGQRPASPSTKIWGHLGVDKTCSVHLLSKWAECENLLVQGGWLKIKEALELV